LFCSVDVAIIAGGKGGSSTLIPGGISKEKRDLNE